MAAELHRAHEVGDAAADVRRRLQHDLAQHVGDALDAREVLGQALRVARRELRHLALRDLQ